MSLGTRLTLKTAVLVLAVVVVAVVAVWGLRGLNRDLDAALGQYDRLRETYTLSNSIEQVRSLTRQDPPQTERVRQLLQRLIIASEQGGSVMDDQRLAQVQGGLRSALVVLDEPGTERSRLDQAYAQLNTSVNSLLGEIDDTSARIQQIERDAEDNRTQVVQRVVLTAAITALLAIVVGIWQYLAVMNPLRRLQRGVERLASGDFADRLKASGDREFVHLADDFNRMADELSTLYQDLEDKVRLRSSQLAQSERLASVGFLAAGVAHEINNPLAIIAGEAELALGALPADADGALCKALVDIRDEAFRCKGITQKLLSLARPGSDDLEPVVLVSLANEVASLIRTLPQHAGRTLTVQGDESVAATSDAPQLKQVLLNLVINALEAVEPGRGRVDISVEECGEIAAIAIRDNGKGLDADSIERVFQPFYTERKSPTTPGLGLGLSISHAIIEDLGGRLFAVSEGIGRGSTFTIELPTQQDGTTL